MKTIRVCCGDSCVYDGAESIVRTIEENTGLQAGESNDEYDFDRCGCKGYCGLGPVVVVDGGRVITEVEKDTVMGEINKDSGDVSAGSIDVDIDTLMDDLK